MTAYQLKVFRAFARNTGALTPVRSGRRVHRHAARRHRLALCVHRFQLVAHPPLCGALTFPPFSRVRLLYK